MKQIEHAEVKLELDGMLFTWDDEKKGLTSESMGWISTRVRQLPVR
ncbi:MAG: hypothetical protein IJG65_01090 [Synergistaceae bacterium]|nr:hypothetical protein [Synergistaceae bacterium]